MWYNEYNTYTQWYFINSLKQTETEFREFWALEHRTDNLFVLILPKMSLKPHFELSFNFHLELGTFGYWIRTDYRTDGTIKLIFGGFIKSIKRGLKMSSRFLDWNFSKFFLLEKVVGKRKMSEGGICPRL